MTVEQLQEAYKLQDEISKTENLLKKVEGTLKNDQASLELAFHYYHNGNSCFSIPEELQKELLQKVQDYYQKELSQLEEQFKAL